MNNDDRWPRLGDNLFTQDGNWLNACVGWTNDQWHGYAEGYRRAGEVLVQHIIDTERGQDYLIFPIVFLYRQAVEISLKYLIWTGNQLHDREPSIPTHHRLVPLWKHCRPIIEQVWPDGPKQDLDAVGKVLDQFEARDPISTVFRYPVTKEGHASLAVNEQINILNFAEVAERVFTLLHCCSGGFYEYLQNKREQERECWERC